MPTYQAVSIQQPWGNLIRDGRKTIETRVWPTSYRGALLLCACQKPAIAPFGCTVCLVDLIDCRPMQPEDWAAACIAPYGGTIPSPFARKGRPPPQIVYGWHLANVRPVPPVPVLGCRGRIFPVVLPNLLRRR